MSHGALFDRSDYPALDGSVYLNQASLGLIGRPATAAMHRFLDDVGRHGNLYMDDDAEVAFLEGLRQRAAELFDTGIGTIAVLTSASELLSQVPLVMPPAPGSSILAVTTDFPATTRPWLRLAERGECRVRFVDDDPETDLTSELISRIDADTWLVSVSSVQYATGTVVDVPRLRAATQEAGVKLVVDATQGAGAMRASTWDAEVVVSSGYKWLGGHGGAAVGAVAPELFEVVPPLTGWMGAPDPFHMDATRLRLAPDARRYIQATMSYVSVVGLTVAMDQLLGRGIDQVEEHAGRLAGQLVETVEPKGWSPFRRPEDAAASPHIVSLGHPSHDLAETTDLLWAAGIVCSARGGRVRVSLAPYNDEEDIARLVDALPA